MTAKVGGSARYSLSCPLSRHLEDTLGSGDDAGGGVFLHGGLVDVRSQCVCGVPVSPLEGLEGAGCQLPVPVILSVCAPCRRPWAGK